MKFKFRENIRKFLVGVDKGIELSDCGEIFLDSDEQVTFNDAEGNEYDVCKKKNYAFDDVVNFKRHISIRK